MVVAVSLSDPSKIEDSSIIYEALVGANQHEAVSPEINLLLAILKHAIRDAYREPIQDASCPCKQALRWLHVTSRLEKEDLEDPLPFSFVWVLESLGLSPIWFHKNLKVLISKKDPKLLQLL